MQLLHSVHGWSLVCRDVRVSVEGFLQVAPQIVSWQGISCTVPQGRSGRQRKILHSISGVAAVTGEDGQLMPCLFAVLGPSGAGKTTFMDILSGRKRDPGKIGKTTFMDILSGRKRDPGKLGKTIFMHILSGRKRDPGKLGQTTFHAHPVWLQSRKM